MLSREDNELMCRVGPGTAMGAAIRHFWVPACLSAELPEPDGDPLHVELLGENFVAFRDSNGQVGLLDEHCCHRGASLTVGRVEQCGIRCIYHGWLFAADGTVLETPNVQDERFKTRFKARAYPVREAGGLVWAYLGDADKMPPFPDFEWIGADAEKRLNTCQINPCNFVQMLEGLLDSAHLTVLHSGALAAAQGSDLGFVQATSHMQFDAAPRIESEATDFGLHYAALRRQDDGTIETRVTAFIAPFWILNPNGDIATAVVPMSDTKTAFYTVWWDGVTSYGTEPLRSRQLDMIGFDRATLEAYGQTRATADGPGAMRRANRFRQDRELMRGAVFSGMPKLVLEDSLVCVSAGPLRDRSRERLAPADMAVAHLYRHYLKTAKRVRDGQTPIGYGKSVGAIRATNARLPAGSDWRALVPGNLPPGGVGKTARQA